MIVFKKESKDQLIGEWLSRKLEQKNEETSRLGVGDEKREM